MTKIARLAARALARAADSITPETWTRGCLARDAAGEPVQVDDPAAVRFCALGAIRRAACDEWRTQAAPTVAVMVIADQAVALLQSAVNRQIGDWNDFHSPQYDNPAAARSVSRIMRDTAARTIARWELTQR